MELAMSLAKVNRLRDKGEPPKTSSPLNARQLARIREVLAQFHPESSDDDNIDSYVRLLQQLKKLQNSS